MARSKKTATPAAGPKPAVAARANPHRGESRAAVIKLGGQAYPLMLTMNALVDIEEGLGVPLSQLGQALTTPTVKQVRTLIGALVRGGGADLSDEDVGRQPLNIAVCMAAVQSCFEAAGVFDPDAEPDNSPQM